MEFLKVLSLLFLLGIVSSVPGKKKSLQPSLSGPDSLKLQLNDYVNDLWMDLHDPDWVNDAEDTGFVRAFANIDRLLNSYSIETPTELDTVWLWARLDAQIRGITGLYVNLQRLLRFPGPANRRDLIDFADTVLSDARNSVPAALERIHELALDPGKEGNIFEQALKVVSQPNSRTKFLY